MKRFVIFSILFLIRISNSENVYDVTKFGADPTGVNKSTEAVKQAIDVASGKGGGTIFFPKGEYLCGPIHLKSNITIHLEESTTIKFSKDFDDYLPMVHIRWEGTVLNSLSPLIYANKQQNLVIRGKGVLEGQGSYWLEFYQKLVDEYHKTKKRDTKIQEEFLRVNNLTELANETMDMSRINVGFLRPPFIQLFDSKNILIEDITVQNSPFWNINPVFCENVTIRGAKIKAPNTMGNTDGIDPDSSKDVFISDVEIDVGDDNIAIKSGRDLQGRRIGRPTENVVISNCKMLRGGGLAIGSEQSGGVKNITVKNCVFNGTKRGIFLKSERGRGGVVEDIYFKNISMTGIKQYPIVVYYGSGKVQPFSERTPVFRNMKFHDIRGESEYSVRMSGIPESLFENIEMKNIEIISKKVWTSNFTTNLTITGLSLKSSKVK